MKPKISVIITAYNLEKYISKCIESVANQTYENLEIAIIDDGSTNASGDVFE
jgi:glycosyltransferase involved in cell wall biosynthesis